MGEQGRWFKLWTTAPEDPHLGNLTLQDFARWCLLGVYLKVHGTDGSVTVIPPAVAFVRALRFDTFERAMDFVRGLPNCTVTLVTTPTVTCTVLWANWMKYQGDYSGDRVRRFRDNQRRDVTPKKRREEKRREEKKLPPSSPPAQGSLMSSNGSRPESEFDRFWQVFPRKVGKGAARQAWTKRHPPITVVLVAIAKQRESEQWRRDGGQFIPHPSTWLNEERWLDEPEAPPESDPYAKFPRVH